MYADKVTDSMAVANQGRPTEDARYSRSTTRTMESTPSKGCQGFDCHIKAVNADDKHFKKDQSMDEKELKKLSKELEKMHQAAAELNFEEAARLRDRMIEIKKMLQDM